MPASSARLPHRGESPQGTAPAQVASTRNGTSGGPPTESRPEPPKTKPPNSYHHIDPPRPLANAQQIMRARYKDRNIPARTWKQEEARKRESELPKQQMDLVSAAKRAQQNARSFVSEAEAHTFGKVPAPRVVRAQRQRTTPRPAGGNNISATTASRPNSTAANNHIAFRTPASHSSTPHSSAGLGGTKTSSASVSPRQSLSSGVPFPSMDASRELTGTSTPERPGMRRNSSLLSLAAAKVAQNSPTIRRGSANNSRRGSVAPIDLSGLSARSHSISVGSLSPTSGSSFYVGTSPTATAGAKASEAGIRSRSREHSLSSSRSNSGSGRGIGINNSNSTSTSIGSRTSSAKNLGPLTPAKGDITLMFGGIPAPQSKPASAAARASTHKQVTIAPRAPMSAKFVKSLSSALKREHDNAVNADRDNEEKTESRHISQNRVGPSISSKATANVTRRLGHTPGTPITPIESNRTAHSIGSQRGANSAFAANISPKVSNTEKERARLKAQQEMRANAQLAATKARNRIEENLNHLDTNINMAHYLDSNRKNRRELMKKYRPAASWSAPARALRPQLKRLTTNDTIDSLSGDQGGSVTTPKPSSLSSQLNTQLFGDAYKYKGSSNLRLSNNSSSSSLGGASIGGSSIDSKRLAPLITNFGSSGKEFPSAITPGPSTGLPNVPSSAVSTVPGGGPLVAGAPLFPSASAQGINDPLTPSVASPNSPGRVYNRPGRMATTLRRSNKAPRPVSRSETAPEFDHRTTNGTLPLPGAVNEPSRAKTALGQGAGGLYGGLEPTPGLVESNSVSSSSNSLPQTLKSQNNTSSGMTPPLSGNAAFSASSTNAYPPPPQTQPRMLSTLRNSGKFDRRQFNSEKPWKGHRELTAISERERKRYESLWAANRDRHLPYIYVPHQYQDAWFDALQKILPALKPLIDSEKDNLSDTASTTTVATTNNVIRPPSLRSSRSQQSIRSVSSNLFDHRQDANQHGASTGSPAGPSLGVPMGSGALIGGQKQNNRAAHSRTFSGSSGIYVPFGPSQPPPSLLTQSQQHQQQARMARMQLNHPDESASSFGSVSGVPMSPLRTKPKEVTSQESSGENNEPLSPSFSTSSQEIWGFGSESPRIVTSSHFDNATAAAAHSGLEAYRDIDSVYEEHPEVNEDESELLPEVDMAKEVEGRINDVHGYIVARIWRRSHLPEETLSKIWELVDHNHDGTLDSSGFIVGMWLCDQCLYGRKLPPKVPVEVWQSVAPLNLKIRFKEKTSKMGHVKKLPNYFGSAVGFTWHGGRQAVKRAVQTATK